LCQPDISEVEEEEIAEESDLDLAGEDAIFDPVPTRCHIVS